MSKNTTITAPPRELVLRACKDAIEVHSAEIRRLADQFQDAILPGQLKIGKYCLLAHAAYAVQDPRKRGAMKGRKSSSTVEELSFGAWLAAHHPHLKEATAYRWIAAFKGLGLPETCSEKKIDGALQTLRTLHARDGLPAPTLKSLVAAAVLGIEPERPEPPLPQQQDFDFLRGELSRYREFSETLVGLRNSLEQFPDILRAATARAYSVLRDLTGQHWAPSEMPNELDGVDPNTLEL